MAADELSIDTLSLDDFRLTLAARLDEAHACLVTLATAGPASWGSFEDARRTEGRHARLREQFVARIGRLVDAVTVAEAATTGIAERFATAEKRHTARAQEIADRLRGVAESLHGRR